MPNLLDLDQLSVRFSHGHRRPVDTGGHVRAVADLVVDEVSRRTVTRADGTEEDEIRFRGHAAVFNSRTWIGGRRWGFWEEIAPGAFAGCLARPDDVRFLVNHSSNLVLARNTSETMTLAEDDRGLLVEATLAPTSTGRDTAILLERRDITQMSFAFDVGDYEYSTDPEDRAVYRHTRIEQLWDVSVVTYPAYDETDAALRTIDRLIAAGDDPAAVAERDGAGLDAVVRTAVADALHEAGVVPAVPAGGDPAGDRQRAALLRRHLATRTRTLAPTPQQKG